MDSCNKSVSKDKLTQSKKMKAPQVRQTLTSKYRMLKANPLLVHELEKKITSNNKEESVLITPLKTLVNVLDTDSEVLSKFNISYNPDPTSFTLKSDKSLRRCESNKEISKHEFVPPVALPRKKLTLQSSLKANPPKKAQSVPKLVTDRNLNMSSSKTVKKKFTTGSSLSAVQKIKTVKHVNNDASVFKNKKPSMPAPIHSNSQQIRNDQKELKTQHNTKTKLSNTDGTPHSTNNLRRVSVTPNKPQLLKITCTDKDTQKSSMITPDIRSTLTPVFSARKNSLFNTPSNNRKSIFVSKQISNEVTQKLSEWLEIKGKSFKEYHHLKCFGVHAENTIKALNCDGEKENIENSVIIENNNFIKEPPATPEKINLPAVAQTALVDLHKLILDGYPPEQCDIWLKLIKQKCGQVEEEPQYWECRAALEQTKGNINLAVECYKTAIIQGAEVQNVDKCLDQLLQKFSLLNICNESGPHVNKNDRNKIVQDARNIFKSSIIQFAVQEKVLKKKTSEGTTVEKRVFATPVRRSTRLSRSAFTSTPGIHIYSSLQELDASVRDNLNFQCNSALKE